MVKGARQREWPRHLSTHTHTHWTLPTTMSVLETPFDIHVSSVYQTHTCMQAPIPTLCISAKKTHNKGSRTRPIMSTLMPRSGIPVICSRATLSCDSSYCMQGVPRSTLVFGLLFPSFADSRRASCQLLAKEWALNTGKLHLRDLPRNSMVK